MKNPKLNFEDWNGPAEQKLKMLLERSSKVFSITLIDGEQKMMID